MREYKFRAWDDVEKRFWYFTLQEILERRMSYRGSFDEKILEGDKDLYTEIKDKNDVEIYERDIIRRSWMEKGLLKHMDYTIKYTLGCFYCTTEGSGIGLGLGFYVTNKNSDLEVIGNIHENKKG